MSFLASYALDQGVKSHEEFVHVHFSINGFPEKIRRIGAKVVVGFELK